MTDFLTRIAERTLGVAPVAQPIIAPLFAPGPAVGAINRAPTTAPASLEIDEMQEGAINRAPTTAQKVRPSIARTVPQPPVTRIDEESTIASRRPSPGTIDAPISTQTSKPVFSQQEERLARTTGSSPKRATPAPVSRETSIRSNLVSEPVPPAPIAIAQPLPIEEVKEVPAASAGDVPANQQPARTLLDKQATPLETHKHRPATSPDEHSGEKRTVPPAQPVNTPPGSVRIEYVPLASEPHIAPPQLLTQEVIEIREVQSIAPEQQGTSSYAISSKPMQERGGRDQARPYTGEQGLLVPKSDRQGQQSVTHQESTSLTISYGEVDAMNRVPTPGKPAITVVEQHPTNVGAQFIAPKPTPSTPTIRVTIGRIDVRAVTPSESTNRPKPTRAAPRISLEDYARQNKQGGR